MKNEIVCTELSNVVFFLYEVKDEKRIEKEEIDTQRKKNNRKRQSTTKNKELQRSSSSYKANRSA